MMKAEMLKGEDGGSRVVQAAVRGMLNNLVESAPAGAAVGRAPAVAWAGLRLAAMVLLAAGVGIGLGDGDEFDDVGCSVAQKPEGKKAEMLKAEMLKAERLKGEDGGAKAENRTSNIQHRTLQPEDGGRRTEDGGTKTEHPTSNIQPRTLNAGEGENAYEGKAEMLKAERLKSEAHGGETETQKPEPEEPNISLAAKVFELLTALDPDSRLRKAPPIKVFLLRFRQNLSRAEIARTCRCDKSLVGVRLKTIQDKLPWRPQQLRELSAQVEAMQDAVSDSRARRIYRKGAAYGEEDDGGEAS
jgi:hypothetical protein